MAIARTSPASSSAQLPESVPSVLIVDDVKSTRDHLSAVLRRGGYDVHEAGDGRDALRALATTPSISAILLDLVMPFMDGWEFREFQLRDARLNQIPTLVLTVKALTEHDRYALRLAAAMTIRKPFPDDQLLDKVANIIANSPATRLSECRWLTQHGQPLLWSKHGCIACEIHAPSRGSAQWITEGWAWIPPFAGKNKIQYACQECGGGPIRHDRSERKRSDPGLKTRDSRASTEAG